MSHCHWLLKPMENSKHGIPEKLAKLAKLKRHLSKQWQKVADRRGKRVPTGGLRAVYLLSLASLASLAR